MVLISYGFFSGTAGGTIHSSLISDFMALEQSLGFRIVEAAIIGRSMYLEFAIVDFSSFLGLVIST